MLDEATADIPTDPQSAAMINAWAARQSPYKSGLQNHSANQDGTITANTAKAVSYWA
jgi:hypothetical protein